MTGQVLSFRQNEDTTAASHRGIFVGEEIYYTGEDTLAFQSRTMVSSAFNSLNTYAFAIKKASRPARCEIKFHQNYLL
jgi:hypothetical protein